MKSKKIVLSTTPTEGEFINWTTPKHFAPKAVRYMPLGILSLASNIDEHHHVVLLDPSSEGWTIEETVERIEKENADIVGLSVPTRRVYAMRVILQKASAPYKVVGGPHATYYADQILEMGADAVFVGALAENEFRAAVTEQPKGIIRCRTQVNDINFPRRDLLKVETYFPKVSVLFKAENRLPMFSSVGCPNRCTYCNVQSKRLQLKNAAIVVDEMQYLYRIGCRSVHVLDDNFNIKTAHVRSILDEMEKRDFRVEWSGRGQVRTDLTLAKRMAASGFKRIHVGFEALDDDILGFYNKNLRLKQIEAFCEAMNSAGIDMLGYFITGSPLETETYWNSLEGKIRQLGISMPFFNILFPEPDTPYYQSLLRDGHYKKDYWAEYMRDPAPNFAIPYPYGEQRKQEVLAFNDSLIQAFKKN